MSGLFSLTNPAAPRRWVRAALAMTLLAAALSACEVGPDYERPPARVPALYKEVEGWKPSDPQDLASRGAWWAIYDDPLLSALEEQVSVSNQTLAADEAAYRNARAVVEATQATLFPTLSLTGSAQRSGGGARGAGSSVLASGGATPAIAASTGPFASNQFNVALGASWEPDIWGRIRRTLESNVASAQVSAADLAAARLSAQATLATDYFQLRAADELKHLLDATIVAYKRSLEITQNQYKAGFVSKADELQAETQLKTTEAQAINVGVQRAQLEHAIAVLVGIPPAELTIEMGRLARQVPVVPAGVPSTLLERNPTVAAAERQMAAANAQIGVAVAAYFPALTLTGSYGVQSSEISKLLQYSTTYWSYGAQLAQTVFDAGLRTAQVKEARATYDQQVANYRQSVLTIFQQVEDQLAALRILEQESTVEDEAVKAAQEAVRILLNQYRAGTVAYTSVVTSQATALADEQTTVTIEENRLVASVSLIAALGGGWDVSQLPNAEQVEDETPLPDTPAARAAALQPPEEQPWYAIFQRFFP